MEREDSHHLLLNLMLSYGLGNTAASDSLIDAISGFSTGHRLAYTLID